MTFVHSQTVVTNAAKTVPLKASISPSPNRLRGSPMHDTRRQPNEADFNPKG
ncbi:uncharacterized protein PpBr36_09292 [Pyricularia pennisetigena]|uniref:uncharacterized protein n=1 Tax=Pyricularia pennisetigena TaxID=1578925 RepID=UPI001152F73A|nr:uncharacterized protein PpBr36_09292 [Pyricularia pennisetigena]TLS22036.1 hypothetical protein PpBr36_09292 [Pyricularia pennisetigena]